MRESARDDRSFVGRLGPLFCSACIVLAAGTSAWGADWPTHQGNNARTGITLERIRFPLSPVWVRESAAPPSPAWPDAAGEYSRIDYDSAPQPVVAKGIVYVGSNTDDTLRAIEAASGEIKWEFTAGGPIRFAPAVADGRVYLSGLR